jgi:hypothetical protein
VVTLGNQHDVVVGDRHSLIKAAVLGIDPLEAEPAARRQAVIMGLLKIGDPRKVVLVMAVGRVGRPMASGSEDLGDKKAVGHIAPLHRDVVDVAQVGAFAARLERDPLRAENPGEPPALPRRRADRQRAGGRRLG